MGNMKWCTCRSMVTYTSSMCLIAIVTFKNRYINILKRNSLFFIFINKWMNAYCKNEKINEKKGRYSVITV